LGAERGKDEEEGKANEAIKSIQVDEDIHYELKGLAHKNRDLIISTASRLLRSALDHEKQNSGTQRS